MDVRSLLVGQHKDQTVLQTEADPKWVLDERH